jgi:ring-1,2-phenylacetyl-CoA epoxidase subunit PaaE
MAAHFHTLTVKRVTPDAAGSAAITLQVPPELHAGFDFQPGQFLTLRTAAIDGEETRRSYSICSPRQRFVQSGEIDIGIKPIEGGTFSRWALASLHAGQTIEVLPPEGRFTPRAPGARHRVGFAAGSGITPVLSIMATTLAAEPESRFTLVYGNQRVNTIMFNEALQDLKDRYPARVSLIHLLSRQAQEVELLNGRIDEAKVTELLRTMLAARHIDEAFICGPEGMIDATQRALLAGGVPPERILTERFFSIAQSAEQQPPPRRPSSRAVGEQAARHRLEVVLDGKTHQLAIGDDDRVLDVALEAGLDLPYSCRAGVCCTCRARVLEGKVEMEKNFTLEPWEVAKGFVLTCQARPLSDRLVVSYDER